MITILLFIVIYVSNTIEYDQNINSDYPSELKGPGPFNSSSWPMMRSSLNKCTLPSLKNWRSLFNECQSAFSKIL